MCKHFMYSQKTDQASTFILLHVRIIYRLNMNYRCQTLKNNKHMLAYCLCIMIE